MTLLTRNPPRPPRRGVAIVYATMAMLLMFGFASLAVDWGRVQVAKTQLQTAADASARSGALSLKNVLYGTSAAYGAAAATARLNTVDGQPVVLDPSADVEIGYWFPATHTFFPLTDPTYANAVRVTARRIGTRGTAIPLLFLRALGRSTYDVQAQSIALLQPAQQVNVAVPATSNPFLAGALPGTSASNGNPHNNPDWSYGTPGHPNSSPAQAFIPIAGGQAMTFDGATGTATYDPGVTPVSSDGDPGYVLSNSAGSEHGISNLYAPINSLIAVYLNDNVPTPAAGTPPVLDFSSAASRDFVSLSPRLNQIFFVGDGRTSGGVVQQFISPPGATRLFIGDMDGYEWNNNVGQFNITVHGPAHVTTVH